MNRFKLFLKVVPSLAFSLFLITLPVVALAQSAGGTTGFSPGGTTGFAPAPANTNGYGADGSFTLQNPLAVNSFCQLINLLLKAALAIGIPIAVLFIVYAGFKFVLARGSSEQLDAAKKNLFYTIIGIGIFLGASLIATVIINTLQQLGVNNISSC